MNTTDELIQETITAIRQNDPDISLSDPELAGLLKKEGAAGILPHINKGTASDVEKIFTLIETLGLGGKSDG